jgi:flagellar biosynthesis anti-sigma factor FlgM
MKIRGTQTPARVDVVERASVRPKNSPSSVRAERVRVSEEAKAFADARGPEAPDRARIERIIEAIRSGQFAIDAERIADAMLREER